MRKATKADKKRIVDILSVSFDKNPSVNYIIQQGDNRVAHIRSLMSYSFDLCNLFGDVFVSEDDQACALIIYPDKKKTTLLSTWLNIRLIFRSIGVRNLRKAIAREALLQKVRGNEPMCCLWFIGVAPDGQHKGVGSILLRSVIKYCSDKGRPIYLETSNSSNLPWYQKFGFNVYAEKNLGHTLYFLKRIAKK